MAKIRPPTTPTTLCPDYDQSRCITQPGDRWRLGDHVLLCGDARDDHAYQRLMAGERAAYAITDPPYNVKIDGHAGGLGRVRHREFAMASGEMSQAEFAAFLGQVFQQIRHHTVDGAIAAIFMDWRHMAEMLVAGQKTFAELKNLCIWVKPNGGMGSFYRSRHELAFIWKCSPGKHVNNFELGQHGRSRTNVWEYAGVNSFKRGRMQELESHPTVKPVAMIADAIRDCSRGAAISFSTRSAAVARSFLRPSVRAVAPAPSKSIRITAMSPSVAGKYAPASPRPMSKAAPRSQSGRSRHWSSPNRRCNMPAKRKNRAATSSVREPVGYGRPPVEIQFKPGASGNPNGRPKKSRNLKTIIRNALTANVIVREGEKKRSVSKLEGIVLRQLESALKGNDKAALATLKMAAQVGLLEVGDTRNGDPAAFCRRTTNH